MLVGAAHEASPSHAVKVALGSSPPHRTDGDGEDAYARKAVVSPFMDHARRRPSTRSQAYPTSTVSSGQDVAESVTARASLMSALADVPSRQRACVVLRYFEDLSVADTASVLGCSAGTVKSQTSRALVSLRSVFGGSPLGELETVGTSSW